MIALVMVKFNDKLVLRGLKVLVGPTNVSSVICWTIKSPVDSYIVIQCWQSGDESKMSD